MSFSAIFPPLLYATTGQQSLPKLVSGVRTSENTGRLLVRAEIHTRGSTIYEIATGRQPFCEKPEEQEREVEQLIKEGKHPDVSKLPLGDVIAKCWKRDGFFNSAADVAEEMTRSTARPVMKFFQRRTGGSRRPDLVYESKIYLFNALNV
ncbi:hypothetical protein BDY21DRAFT_366776 [Lineolata rhizophorae]|uniref:Protein kinase domain-containing protein n=1 Tax=Lineolata rhizophorae TaxID=578093 RepID=A0A6A6NPS2_9PEZI|nr:hypothetical protein BDY21DRAFT_366776 [Lineolata rhizophorae]